MDLAQLANLGEFIGGVAVLVTFYPFAVAWLSVSNISS